MKIRFSLSKKGVLQFTAATGFFSKITRILKKNH